MDTPSQAHALAIETSGRLGSIALMSGATLLAEASFNHGLKQAAGLLPLIDRLLQQQGWTPASLQYLYVSHGPGSFTGLRIGITLAKTLAMVTGARLVAVPTLRVLATNAPADAQHIIVLLDAKRDQIFTARYHRQSDQLIEEEPAHLDTLVAMLSRAPRPVNLIGEGLAFHKNFLPVDQQGITLAPEPSWTAQAKVVAAIGIQLASAGKFVEPDDFLPLYVRIPEAQEKYDLLHGRR